MEQVAKLKKNWNLASILQIVQRISVNYCPCLYLSIGNVWCLVSKDIFKNDVTDLIRYELVKITKTWIPWERNITFLQKKKFIICASDYECWDILRSYRFIVELTEYCFSYTPPILLLSFYIRFTYSIFCRWLRISSKSGKHSSNFSYIEGCLSS